jgi:hypothetical protein
MPIIHEFEPSILSEAVKIIYIDPTERFDVKMEYKKVLKDMAIEGHLKV